MKFNKILVVIIILLVSTLLGWFWVRHTNGIWKKNIDKKYRLENFQVSGGAGKIGKHFEINDNRRKNIYFDIKIDDKSLGRINMELYDDKLPLTCKNFREMVSQSSSIRLNEAPFKNSIFHRVIPNFMIQGGDFTNFDGTGGISIYGQKFNDEGFFYNHTKPGLLSMANSGPDTNGSQFFITTAPAPWLDGKHVVFGEVTKGMDIVRQIEKVKTDSNDKPLQTVKISCCGELV